MEIALAVKSLSVNLGGKQILKNIDFSIPKGGLTVLIGANGSGKTTLLRSICGNLQTISGDIIIFGKRQRLMKRPELSQFVSYIPQAHTPVFCYSVLDFVLMGSVASKRIYEQPTEKEIIRATDIIKSLFLEKFIQTDYSILSGGERQLALIARGLMQNSPLLLLDEPVANLDFVNQHRIMKILKDLSDQNVSILTALHDPNLAFKYADHAVFLHKAQVTASLNKDQPDYVSSFQNVLKDVYGGVQLTTSEHFEVIT